MTTRSKRSTGKTTELKFPTPAEVTGPGNENGKAEAERHFPALLKKIERSNGNEFTYADELMPKSESGLRIIKSALAAAGWKMKHTSDWRDGDFYTISPVSSR